MNKSIQSINYISFLTVENGWKYFNTSWKIGLYRLSRWKIEGMSEDHIVLHMCSVRIIAEHWSTSVQA